MLMSQAPRADIAASIKRFGFASRSPGQTDAGDAGGHPVARCRGDERQPPCRENLLDMHRQIEHEECLAVRASVDAASEYKAGWASHFADSDARRELRPEPIPYPDDVETIGWMLRIVAKDAVQCDWAANIKDEQNYLDPAIRTCRNIIDSWRTRFLPMKVRDYARRPRRCID